MKTHAWRQPSLRADADGDVVGDLEEDGMRHGECPDDGRRVRRGVLIAHFPLRFSNFKPIIVIVVFMCVLLLGAS